MAGRSSCVAGFDYSDKTLILTIYFVKGGSYSYYGVPADVAAEVGRGGQFNASIRLAYPYSRN
jgi:hypothetical protein